MLVIRKVTAWYRGQDANEQLNVQRALNQPHQYKRRYQNNLILFVLLQDALKPASQSFIQEELRHRNIRSLFR